MLLLEDLLELFNASPCFGSSSLLLLIDLLDDVREDELLLPSSATLLLIILLPVELGALDTLPLESPPSSS